MLSLHGQKGMSLVEMLVSLIAGLVVVAGAISLFSTVIVSGNTTLMLSRLNQDIQAVTDIIARDIQRAGHHPSAAEDIANGVSLASSTAALYMFSTSNDLYPAPASGASSTCIRVKYWDNDTPSGASSLVRIYGYDSVNKRLSVDTSYSAPVSSALTASDCASGDLLISDAEVLVDNLEFEVVSGSNPTGARALNIRMTASNAQKNNLSMSLERSVRIRNDGY
ncbi:type IV pilin [Zobellella endophytica]|uniref:Type IV pilin n=1 Tax=Zobellella endophytica TaxID=2116700 RepID=A0A2P7QXJ9_9GAMM|nr:prepilin-type N-terminal cleavage/methylation domain-containing protein [Zobellella endophytica]PSJ42683.1 type IV pilin [Zobellella endophytica]